MHHLHFRWLLCYDAWLRTTKAFCMVFMRHVCIYRYVCVFVLLHIWFFKLFTFCWLFAYDYWPQCMLRQEDICSHLICICAMASAFVWSSWNFKKWNAVRKLISAKPSPSTSFQKYLCVGTSTYLPTWEYVGRGNWPLEPIDQLQPIDFGVYGHLKADMPRRPKAYIENECGFASCVCICSYAHVCIYTTLY